ncbi:hypothetical protein [Actinocrispum wychmicini]|uniref:Uncharacterized protein n=1 Tax=Actinocrispum wychmicini TaxID=1213861 RepID=A0A4R2JCP0_9PSEU|nr:hypothetical protein [Actinocrispum wychmicini]TCO57343.1 hypothetical protein EV192_106820 [Actinocrispum wychmicini]
MTTSPPEINFSELSNKPVEAVRKLSESPTRSLVVHRRGEDEDLMLITASRVAEEREVVSFTTKVFAILMQTVPEARGLMATVLPKVLPWVRFLSEEGLRTFIVELFDVLEAAESLDNLAPVIQLITEWQHTAEVLADPELVAILQQDSEDLDEIPEPGSTEGMGFQEGDQVPPPAVGAEWEIRFKTDEAVNGWQDLENQAASNLREAWETMRNDPGHGPGKPNHRHHRLHNVLSTGVRDHRGLPQWQIEVTSNGRIWYLLDEERHTVWVTHAGIGHPKATE